MSENSRVEIVKSPALFWHGSKWKRGKKLHPAWKAWRGKTITVGAPQTPSDNWKCGTKLVWPVVTKKVLKAAERKEAFVCCHQVKFKKETRGGAGMSRAPQRIQRKRSKGWKMPPNTVYVGRPRIWGNPFPRNAYVDARTCVDDFKSWLWDTPNLRSEIRRDLRGKDLACWCPLDQPCHADVLLEIANAEEKIS